MITTGSSLLSAHEAPSTKNEFTPNIISMFWHHIDDKSFDPTNRENNETEHGERFFYSRTSRTHSKKNDNANDKEWNDWN